MATIALYSNQIAQMSGMFGEVKKTVNDYKSELFSLKTKALAIKQSICNMEDVISSIQASTSVQEEKVDSLEQARGSSEQFIEDTYRIDVNVADLVNKRKDDFYDQYKYLKPECEKNGWEKFKDGCKKAGEWCKEHWKTIVTVVLVIAAIVVIVVCPAAAGALLVAMAKAVLVGASIGGLIGGTISAITGGDFWKGFEDGAFMGAIAGLISGGMGFAFTGAVKGVSMTLGQTLLSGGGSGIGSILLSDLGDIGIKGEVMSLKKIVFDVVVGGLTGVVFAGIGYGIAKAFSALKLKIINKGGTNLDVKGYSNFADGMSPEDAARYITNNEARFFEEFSERASASGLNSTQIAEAYSAMKVGDYSKMASYFDTSSPVDSAVFWSGNKEGAAVYANSVGGTIMEQTPGGQVFDNWRGLQGMYPEWDMGITPQKPIWTALSSQYAEGASGNVTYAVKEGYANPKSVWKTVEFPILKDLQDDGIVTNITTHVIKE